MYLVSDSGSNYSQIHFLKNNSIILPVNVPRNDVETALFRDRQTFHSATGKVVAHEPQCCQRTNYFNIFFE